MKALKNILCALGLLALLVCAFALGRRTAVGEPIEQIDTIYHTDTIIASQPIYFTRVVRDTIRVPADTVRVGDTLFVELPREVKEYKDSNYYARVSGVCPELEYIETYNKTQIITQYRTRDPRWSLGIQAGYGVTTSGLSPYIGVGISYDLMSWKDRKR